MSMNRFTDEIVSVLHKRTGIRPDELAQLLEVPPDAQFGDYAVPCFRLSKQLRKAPEKIALELATDFPTTALVPQVTPVGGYLNFRVNQEQFIADTLQEIFQSQEEYGSTDEGATKTIVIDYSSPNIAKPFGVGHLRSTVIGHALSLIYQKLGYSCVGINHLGDWGTQFGFLIAAYKLWGSEDALNNAPIQHLYDIYVRYNTEAEKKEHIAEIGRQWFRRLETGESEATALWKRFSALSLQEFQRIYDLLGIHFDHYTGESFYNDRIDGTVELLQKAGFAQKSQEALIVNLERFGFPPMLLRKRDETTLYSTRDLAAAIYRYEKFHFHKLLYVVGSAQCLHFKQLFTVLELLGYPWAQSCVHVEFGWVKFQDEIMSTRRGNIVFLEDVLNQAIALAEKIIREKNPELENLEEIKRQVGVGAVLFGGLSVRRTKDVNFEWEKVLTFEGETGPYLQYTHARLCSLLRKYKQPLSSSIHFKLLSESELWLVIRKLAEFPQKVKIAAAQYEPAHIASYLLELAGAFNTYYQTVRIITEHEENTRAKLLVVRCVQLVLKEGLRLLGMQAPLRM